MASGHHHAIATVIVGGALSAGLYGVAHCPPLETILFASGCLTGLVINPDLDIRHFTHAEQVLRASGGPLGGLLARLWYTLWWPYAHLIPHHRHPLSHFPLLGTAGRLLYLSILFGLFGYLANWLFKLPPFPEFPPELWPLVAWWAGGLAAMDTLHAVMDSGTRSSLHRLLWIGPRLKPARRRLKVQPAEARPTRL
jgi:uncharacterized metal-binding protein